ncbi:hypothetical protein F5Y18DRAFT_426957 [Xylariaceae sp. FL1019]|nr:hypothetical protein F5Y18DRAFT_426957 [Xylariaceae sp. FL1019]
MIKFLAPLAILAASVQAYIHIDFTNNIPVEGNYTVGEDFVLTWNAYEGSPTETFHLYVEAYNKTPSGYTNNGPYGSQFPILDTRKVDLGADINFNDLEFTWHIQTLEEGWTGSQFYYFFDAEYVNGGTSTRSFHLVEP